MDDGSLVINNYKYNNDITLFPQIALYSQSFTKKRKFIIKKNIYKIHLI